MKLCVFALFSSVLALGADFLTGQAARITIGQPNFTDQDIGIPTQYMLGAVGGLAYANNQLFVVDSNHIQATPLQNRVLIYYNVSALVPEPTQAIPQGTRCPVCIGNGNLKGANVVVGQPDFTQDAINLTQGGFQNPTGVATNGQILVVADTDNNRVLIWKNIPTSNGVNADIVLGQANFTTANVGLSSTGMRGPEGVWIQGARLFVADTQNDRIMVWNSIPTTNNQAADYVLGEPDFTTAPAVTTLDLPPTASNMLSPVSVSSDGQRLFVADLGHARVMVWNSIPTANGAAADFVLGQPNATSEITASAIAAGASDNNAAALCAPSPTSAAGMPNYPVRCYATLSLPRYALSTGTQLFVADGGNDRVMIWNTMPTQNGQKADVVLGQPDEFDDVITDSTSTIDPDANVLRSSPATVRTPLGLAWDGSNLYVSDPFDRRVLVFTPAIPLIPVNGITNAASRVVSALGAITIGGTITATDTIAVTINTATYTYTVVKSDTINTIILNIVNLINAGPDPNVIALADLAASQVILTARIPGLAGNNITYSVTVAAATSSGTATETASAAGSNLTGGQNAGFIAPGTLVTLAGNFLTDQKPVTAVPNATGFYPTKLGGVQVYFDGIAAPLLYVSSTQINAQLPFEVSDANGTTAFVRTERANGEVTATNNIAVPVVEASPGIFAQTGPGVQEPRPALAYHASSYALAVVSVDGSVQADDVATINIDTRTYSYTVQDTDSLATIRDAFITLINSNADEQVTAAPAGQFTRIILQAKVPGPIGAGIPISGSVSTGALVLITVLGAQETCCSNVAGAPITADNPAVPGEIITIYAAGIGPVMGPDGTAVGTTGQIYNGPVFNTPITAVDNAQVGGRSANVLFASLVPGQLGVYQILMQLDPGTPTDTISQMFIAQSVFTSNIVTLPVLSPSPPASTSSTTQ